MKLNWMKIQQKLKYKKYLHTIRFGGSQKLLDETKTMSYKKHWGVKPCCWLAHKKRRLLDYHFVSEEDSYRQWQREISGVDWDDW